MVGDHSNRNGAESGPHFVLPKRTVKQSLWRTLKRGSKCRKKKRRKWKKGQEGEKHRESMEAGQAKEKKTCMPN